jgi:hypothetical protein
MTIPLGAQQNWCPSCDETCNDHPTTCTTCGAELQYPRARRRSTPNTTTLESVNRNLRARIETLSELIHSLSNNHDDSMEHVSPQLWQQLPAELMDPHNTISLRENPTSAAYLDQMPRTNNFSNFFRSCRILLPDNVSLEGIPATFSPRQSLPLSPQTTRLRLLPSADAADDSNTKNAVSLPTNNDYDSHQLQQSFQYIMYSPRGDGVSFVEKARRAQEAGASALIVGNHVAEPWPFQMTGFSQKINIPVVMICQVDAAALLQQRQRAKNNDELLLACGYEENDSADSNTCIICQERFCQQTTVVRIPACGHVFHEPCALQWLQRHSTCPYCRCKLPTDNNEGMRSERTHTGQGNQQQQQDFYG